MINLKKLNCKFYIILFLLLGCSVALANAEIKTALINDAVINMYAGPGANNSVVSQVIYDTPVQVLQKQGNFVLIQTPDNYQGWVDKKTLVLRENQPNALYVKVRNLFANIYQEANMSDHPPLITVPFGTMLPVIQIEGMSNASERTADARQVNNDNSHVKSETTTSDWVKVLLANGTSGWVFRGDVTINHHPLTMSQMLTLSHSFIGLPYLWGGVSSFGIDCSGFVQLLYRQIGVDLPRDANVQVYWPGFISVSQDKLEPGDLIYMGWDKKVSHAAIYLGDHKFIAATTYQNPIVQISDLRQPHWHDIFIVGRHLDQTPLPQFYGKIETIPQKIKQNMMQYSWHAGCPEPLENLAYLTLNYWGFDNKVHQGNMVVHQKVAKEVVDIFRELYYQKYPIEKMQLIDAYRGNDDASMNDNNTSAFNCRAMTDFAGQYSVHSYGLAIDINPLINPYVNAGAVSPVSGARFADRKTYYNGKITLHGPVYEVFNQRGWSWGGEWNGPIKDYQHFEKLLTKKEK